MATVAPDRPVPPGCGAAGAGGHRAADRGVAKRGPVLPRPCRGWAGRAGRRGAAGVAARPRPGPSTGPGHAMARVLGHPDRPPGQRRSACPGTGAASRARHHRARHVQPCADEPARPGSRRPDGAGCPVRAGRGGDPVPGRGAGAAGPVPQRPALRQGADRCRDGRPPAGHGRKPAAGLPGSRRAGVPDRRPVGRPRRGLAGTGPGLRRRPVQGCPRAADPHPPPPGQHAPATAGTSPAA